MTGVELHALDMGAPGVGETGDRGIGDGNAAKGAGDARQALSIDRAADVLVEDAQRHNALVGQIIFHRRVQVCGIERLQTGIAGADGDGAATGIHRRIGRKLVVVGPADGRGDGGTQHQVVGQVIAGIDAREDIGVAAGL